MANFFSVNPDGFVLKHKRISMVVVVISCSVLQILGTNLPTLKQENCHLAEIKIYEVFCFVCYVASEVSSYNHMPKELINCQNVFVRRKGRSATVNKYRERKKTYQVGLNFLSNSFLM